MTTAATKENIEFKPLTLDIETILKKEKAITIAKDGTSEIKEDAFAKSLEASELKQDDVTRVFKHVLHFAAATGKVIADQSVEYVKKDPSFSAEVTVPLLNGNRVTYYVEGTKEVSDGAGGRQTVHGHISNKLEIRGWKAADFGKVRQSFREEATAALKK